MGCIALVRCVLVLRCGLAVVVWYPYAGWGTSASAYKWHQVGLYSTILILLASAISYKSLADDPNSVRQLSVANQFLQNNNTTL